LLAKQITSLTVDFSQSIDLYRYQYISYPELRLNYVRVKNVLIEANGLMPTHLSNALFTKSHLTKTHSTKRHVFSRTLRAAFVGYYDCVIDFWRI